MHMIVWQVVVERQVGAAVSGRTVYILDSAGALAEDKAVGVARCSCACLLGLPSNIMFRCCYESAASTCALRTGRPGSRVQEFDARGRPVRDELQL